MQAHAGSGKPCEGTGLGPEGSGNSMKGFKETAMTIFVLQRFYRSDWKNDKNRRPVRRMWW